MSRAPFSEAELEVIGEHINTTSYGGKFFGRPVPKYNTPITPKENIELCLRREKPYWFPTTSDF